MHMKSYDNLKKSIRKRLSSKRTPLDTTTNLTIESNDPDIEYIEHDLQSKSHDTLECRNPQPEPSTGSLDIFLNAKQHQRQVKVDSIIARVYAYLSEPLSPKGKDEFPTLETLKALSNEMALNEDHTMIEEVGEVSAASIWRKVAMISGDLSSKEPQPPPRYLEDLKTQQYSVLIQDLRTRLMQSGGRHTQHYLDITAALEAKYQTLLKRRKDEPHPATAEEVNELLRGQEELQNPWAASTSLIGMLPNKGLLMKVTDQLSKVKIRDPAVGFLSDAWDGNLDTFEGRARLINNHVNLQEGEPSIFIPTTSSVSDFVRMHIPCLVSRDKVVRKYMGSPESAVMVHIINGSARLDSGWPVIRMRKQVIRYKTSLPSDSSSMDFENQWYLPFRISPDQIVGSWKWSEILKYMEENECNYIQWHNNIAVPAFEEHEKAREKVL